MSNSQQPGMAYEDMWELTYSAKPAAAKMFSNELLIAIFWEESLFNNKEQDGGTAWGFGQVEPAEMYRLENDDARQYGYAVTGLPPRIVVKRDAKGKPTKVRLGGTLTPEQGVQVAAGVLCSFYYTRSRTVNGALRAYAGVGFTGTDVPERLATDAARIAIIHGWQECEAYLKKEWKPDMFAPPPKKGQPAKAKSAMPQSYESDYPTFIKTALKKSRSFDLKDKKIDDILFPKTYVTESGEKIWRPQRTPGWLTDLAKTWN